MISSGLDGFFLVLGSNILSLNIQQAQYICYAGESESCVLDECFELFHGCKIHCDCRLFIEFILLLLQEHLSDTWEELLGRRFLLAIERCVASIGFH